MKQIDTQKLNQAMANGAKKTDAAKAAGVSPSTLSRRVKSENAGLPFSTVRTIHKNLKGSK
jgi:hypothetical protein